MITAVDTNVLLDVFLADREHGEASRSALREAVDQGALVACAVVWAEVAAFFPDAEAAGDALDALGLAFGAMDRASVLEGAKRWSAHRRREGGGAQRIAADFLIGAHALHHADRLLTRDRGFFRSAFKGLRILDPSS